MVHRACRASPLASAARLASSTAYRSAGGMWASKWAPSGTCGAAARAGLRALRMRRGRGALRMRRGRRALRMRGPTVQSHTKPSNACNGPCMQPPLGTGLGWNEARDGAALRGTGAPTAGDAILLQLLVGGVVGSVACLGGILGLGSWMRGRQDSRGTSRDWADSGLADEPCAGSPETQRSPCPGRLPPFPRPSPSTGKPRHELTPLSHLCSRWASEFRRPILPGEGPLHGGATPGFPASAWNGSSDMDQALRPGTEAWRSMPRNAGGVAELDRWRGGAGARGMGAVLALGDQFRGGVASAPDAVGAPGLHALARMPGTANTTTVPGYTHISSI